MNVRGWLRQLGLEEFADAFERERIDLDTLRLLGEGELKELGLPLGPRMKIKAAIGSLDETSGQSASAGAPAERRQLTILFCDLVGSTNLARRLDPERLREVMQAYQQSCRNVIERYDGHVAQYLGDGLMVYFGFPRAHEDSAERAVRSALDIVEALSRNTPSGPLQDLRLQIRIGIATGPVVVGETGAGDAAVPKVAVGETPNLASRLQGLAGPDEIVIGSSTRKLIGETFIYADLGPQVLKGIVEPVNAYRIERVAPTQGRFEASRGAHWIPIVGRESEVSLLMTRWEQAQAGEGQVVLLAGEAGIGKSRLIQAMRDGVDARPHRRLQFQCSPYSTASALFPVIDSVERACGFAASDSFDQKLDKLETLWPEPDAQRSEALALMAMLLALPGDRYPLLAFAPHKQQEKTFNVLLDRVERMAQESPLLLIFEDAHWVDSVTADWLELLVARLSAMRAMLLVTHRPEYAAPWAARSHVTTLALNRLGKRHGVELVHRVTHGKSLPPEVLDQILTKTDGVPLFVEEFTKTVIEGGWLEETSDAYRLSGPLPPLAIPSTLQDSLMARLDRYPRIKELAQISACIGREFSPELLGEVAGLAPSDLVAALGQLSDAQLIFRVSNAGGTSYIFKHALVQDTAYESLLRTRRQQLHADIARAMTERFESLAEQSPNVVARHFTQADLHAEAFVWWQKAGTWAMRRNAPLEAIEHFNRALQELSHWTIGPECDRAELGIQLQLGTAVNSIMGWADSRTGVAFERALTLCDSVANPAKMMQALYGIGAYYTVKGDQRRSMEIAQRFLRAVDGSDDIDARIAANFLVGIVHVMQGRLREGHTHLLLANALYGPGSRPEQLMRFGQDFKPSVLHWLASTHWQLGNFSDSARLTQLAIDDARATGHPYSLGWAYGTAAQMEGLSGEVRGLFDVGSRHSQEHGYVFWVAFIQLWEGAALVQRGQPALALEKLNEAEAMFALLGSEVVRERLYCFKAGARLALGEVQQGLADIEQALRSSDRSGTFDHLGEIHAVRAELLLADSPHSTDQAEAAFQQAISITREQHNRGYLLKAATRYARFLASVNRKADAIALLKPIRDSFPEGDEWRDLNAASTLLRDLELKSD